MAGQDRPNRRAILAAGTAGAGVGVAAVASALPSPAVAQSQPTVRWRLVSSFPKSLDTIYGAAEWIAARVAALTDGRFQIRVFAAGEIVPGLQVLDAVRDGTVECGHTASYYYVGKDPTFAFDCSMPFGLNARQQNAWMYAGGGLELMRTVFKEHGILQFPAGNTGAQMGGWFRKEVTSLDDLKGLKMRIGGIAGQALAKLGLVPQQVAAGEIYPALEKGAIDAAEWVGPHDDEKLGFNKVAKYYYYPGWWDGGPQISLLTNLAQWEALPSAYQAALETACGDANARMLARYDALNPQALKRLVAGGTILKPFPRDVMMASYKAVQELFAEISAANPRFKTIYDSWKPFLHDEYQWFRVSEFSFDNFVAIQTAQR